MDLTFVLLIAVGFAIIVFLLAVLIASMRTASRYTPGRAKKPRSDKHAPAAPKKAKVKKAEAESFAVEPPKRELTAIEPAPVPEPEKAAGPEASLPVGEEPPAAETAEPAPAEETSGAVYPRFSNQRAIDQLGLSQEEADMFVEELIGQIEAEIPNLEAAVAEGNFEKIERVSHMLKGSATSLGEGGIADQLVEFNTYCKHGKDFEAVREFMRTFHREFEALKAQFGV